MYIMIVFKEQYVLSIILHINKGIMYEQDH